MIVMQMSQLTKSYGANTILKDITLDIQQNERIAIVGRNGCGKSTLLKIMAGELSYDGGKIFKRKNLSIGYLAQHTNLHSNETIWNEMKNVFHSLLEQESKLREIEEQMKHFKDVSHQKYKHLLTTYDELQQSFERSGGYEYETHIKTVLSGLDFHEQDYNVKVSTLSGGEKTRLALGKLLLQQPDLLILDEPTNHLDVQSMTWLESYLNNYSGAIVIVSHDRYFLEQTVTTIYELANTEIKKYVGNYANYLQKRKNDYEKQLRAYEQQQKEIKRAEEFIARNIANAATSGRAQSRRKQLERMEKIAKPLLDSASTSFSFSIQQQTGNDVLKVRDVSYGYNDINLFTNIQLYVRRKDRIAIIGPNGIGKTTFLKLITKDLTPKSGQIEYGANVQIGYYSQEQEQLNPKKDVLHELWDQYPQVKERDIRTVLGNFLFTGDDVFKQVHSLSGGEKARLALAKLMMQQANVLVLDEPTNHLDIDSKEVLEAALNDYPGTIIFVSHDRYFINKLANRVVELTKHGSKTYLGNYDYYLEKKQEEQERKHIRQEKKEKTDTKGRKAFENMKKRERKERRRKRKIANIEQMIEKYENDLTQLEHEMTKPYNYLDHEKSFTLAKDAEQLREKIDHLMDEWMNLSEQ